MTLSKPGPQTTSEDIQRWREENANRRRLKEAASPAPWQALNLSANDTKKINRYLDDHELQCILQHSIHGEKMSICCGKYVERSFAASDLLYVAAARNDPVEDLVDALLDEVVRLRGLQLTALEGQVVALFHLHRLHQAGQGDSVEADMIRDAAETSYYDLTAGEKQHLQELSTALGVVSDAKEGS